MERYIKVKNIKINLGKRNLNYSIINTIGGKYLGALKRPNKGRKYNNNTLKNKKYNSNTFKNRNNRTKKLALLGGYFSR